MILMIPDDVDDNDEDEDGDILKVSFKAWEKKKVKKGNPQVLSFKYSSDPFWEQFYTVYWKSFDCTHLTEVPDIWPGPLCICTSSPPLLALYGSWPKPATWGRYNPIGFFVATSQTPLSFVVNLFSFKQRVTMWRTSHQLTACKCDLNI